MYDAALGEPQLQKQVLHDFVVCMGIDAEMSALFISPVDAERSHTFHRAVRRDAVNHTVVCITNPRSVFDYFVGWFDVFTMVDIEGTQDLFSFISFYKSPVPD